MQKILCFREREILNIDINYPKLDNKKRDKFYAAIATAFLDFCERKLYKNAAELFLLREQNGEHFESFYAAIMHEIKSSHEHIKIELNININGEITRVSHVWNISGKLVKPIKIKPPKTKKSKVKKKFRFLPT